MGKALKKTDPAVAEQSDVPTPAVDVQPAKPESASPDSQNKPRARRRKPVGIGKALRQRGFDEHTIADHYVTVAQRLKGKSDESGNVEKLLVDVLKECSKYIEPAKPSDRGSDRASEAPIHVHLVHNVMRPARHARPGGEAEAEKASGAGELSAPCAPSESPDANGSSVDPDAARRG